MPRKGKKSPWGRYKSIKSSRGYVSTNVPINEMSDYSDKEQKALGRYAHEAWVKEFAIRTAQGPHSIPEPHYSKTIKIGKKNE